MTCIMLEEWMQDEMDKCMNRNTTYKFVMKTPREKHEGTLIPKSMKVYV